MHSQRSRRFRMHAFRTATIAAGIVFALAACSSPTETASPVLRSATTTSPMTTSASTTTVPTPVMPPPSNEPFVAVPVPETTEPSAPTSEDAPLSAAEQRRRPVAPPETELPVETLPTWTAPASAPAQPPPSPFTNQALPPEYGVKNVQLGTTCVKGSTGSESSGLIAYCVPVQPGRADTGYMWAGQ
jgi:hypothetical protein